MMRTIRATVLLVGLLLAVGGCAALRGRGKTSAPANVHGGQPATISGSTEAGGPCLRGHGFAILNFRAVRDDYGQISVVGEIKNIGSVSRGVELQASLRDPGGRIVSVGHFCPAASRNIVPGETWPFTYSFGRQDGAVDAELRIVDAFRAIDATNGVSATL